MPKRLLMLAALIAGIGPDGVAIAQRTTTADSAQRFVCEADGLIRGATFGCQLLVRTTVAAFPAGAVFWHLRSIATLADAERARAPQHVIATAGAVVAENIPMRLFNPGAGVGRALFIVVHEPSLAEAAPSQWTSSGACSR